MDKNQNSSLTGKEFVPYTKISRSGNWHAVQKQTFNGYKSFSMFQSIATQVPIPITTIYKVLHEIFPTFSHKGIN